MVLPLDRLPAGIGSKAARSKKYEPLLLKLKKSSSISLEAVANP